MALSKENQKLKEEFEARARREVAGEMGIELAKWIKSNKPENFGALYLALCDKAHAVIDKLEGIG